MKYLQKTFVTPSEQREVTGITKTYKLREGSCGAEPKLQGGDSVLMRRDLGMFGKPQTGLSCCCQDEGLFSGDADNKRQTWQEPALSPSPALLKQSLLVEARREPSGTACQGGNVSAHSQPCHHRA